MEFVHIELWITCRVELDSRLTVVIVGLLKFVWRIGEFMGHGSGSFWLIPYMILTFRSLPGIHKIATNLNQSKAFAVEVEEKSKYFLPFFRSFLMSFIIMFVFSPY